MANFTIRTADLQGVSQALAWAAQEGWNPGIHDAEVLFKADPGGFLLGYLDDQPIASISAVRWGADFGFIGLYIVKPEFRGQGYGIQIWRQAMENLEGRCVGLDGVIAQQGNYSKSGFKFAYRSPRFAGPCERFMGDLGQTSSTAPSWEDIEEFDNACSPAARPAYMQAWLECPKALHAQLRGETLRGWAMARACQEGHKIGPVLAENPEVARQLLAQLARQIAPQETLYIDVPQPNSAAMAICEGLNLESKFECARMYTAPCPHQPDLTRLFAVTSFELG